MTGLELTRKKSRRALRVGLSIAALAVPGALLSSCDSETVFNNKSQAKNEAYQKYFDEIAKLKQPERKFIQQYTKPFIRDVDKMTDIDSFEVYRVKIGNACLKDTPYDISVNYKKGAPIPGIPLGTTPTAVKITGDEPELFKIQPVDSTQGSLSFKGTGGDTELSPADDFTRQVLRQYNCKQNIVEMPVVEVATN